MLAPVLIKATKDSNTQPQQNIHNIDNEYLKTLIAKGVSVIDVRIPYEWNETGIIKGTIPIVFFNEKGQPQAEDWMQKASHYINPDKEVALICKTGRRSRIVAEYLAINCGYKKIYTVDGGIKCWLDAGNSTLQQEKNVA